MKPRWTVGLIAANLCALIALAFAYPHLMVSAGPLLRGHDNLAKDCFQCHAPWRGVDSSRCIRCHQVDRIGVQTAAGAPLIQRASRVPFHSQLVAPSCTECHSDHRGLLGGADSRPRFAHEMLRLATRNQCESCHTAPQNAIHTDRRGDCGKCHSFKAWKPAGFDHAKLSDADRARCHACHKAPSDDLHQQVSGNCGQCHALPHWKPSTFDHSRSWPLDSNHNVSCITCHAAKDYRRYTCYGCHEHSPAEMLAKHAEEGVQDISACVRCHRDASGEGGGGD